MVNNMKSNGTILEKVFNYKGYDCIIMFQPEGYRTAYISIPTEYTSNESYNYKLYGLNVHGGITYDGYLDVFFVKLLGRNPHVIGWDYRNYDDGLDVRSYCKYYKNNINILTRYNYWIFEAIANDQQWVDYKYTLEGVSNDCRNAVEQLIEIYNSVFSKSDINDDTQEELHIMLRNLLYKFTMDNGWLESLWHIDSAKKWKIEKVPTYNNVFGIVSETVWKGNDIYFVSDYVAERALDEIITPFLEQHPEFVW